MILVEEAVYDFIREELWEQVQTSQGGRTGSVITRLVEHVQTVGAVYAATEADLVEPITVQVDHVRRAMLFINKCRDSILDIEKHLAVEQGLQDVACLREIITRTGDEGITRAQLYPLTKLPKYRIDAAITHLLDSEDVQSVKVKSPGRGRPGTRYYEATYTPDVEEVVLLN